MALDPAPDPDQGHDPALRLLWRLLGAGDRAGHGDAAGADAPPAPRLASVRDERPARCSPIVIAAGGTGGHLFPAEALAAELLARGERDRADDRCTLRRPSTARPSPSASASCSRAPASPAAARCAAARRRWRWPPAPCRRAACCASLRCRGRGRLRRLSQRAAADRRADHAAAAAAVTAARAERRARPRQPAAGARADLLALSLMPAPPGCRPARSRGGRQPGAPGDRRAGRPPLSGTEARCGCWCSAARSARGSSPTSCRPPSPPCRTRCASAWWWRSNAGRRTWSACAPPMTRPASPPSSPPSSPMSPAGWPPRIW